MVRHQVDSGAPLDTVILGVANLEESLRFYCEALGLQCDERRSLGGDSFTRYWHLDAGATASAAYLHSGQDAVGRIALLEFNSPSRQQARSGDCRRVTGLFNLNFYTSDIEQSYEQFSAAGFEFWSRPVQHDFGPEVGTPIEVVFNGPDGLAINLVQLETPDRDTLIGEMRDFVQNYGRSKTGYTPVVTSSHTVTSITRAVAFYESVLGMRVVIDHVLESAKSNKFLGLDACARTHVVFVQGAHMFGKIALSEPLNYECESLVERAVAPNIGYLAQSFRVEDINLARAACDEVGAQIYSDIAEQELLGRGRCNAMLVRNPGSGALQEIYQPAAGPG